jgi:DNA polymerase-3 subunit epsilon
VVRTVKEGALAHIGPFRSKKAADLVMHAIWDAIPIRRCRSKPGSRSGRCAGAQLGVAECPCDGTLSTVGYAAVVERLLTAIDTEPGLLLDPLEEKMLRHSNSERFEEAGWLRDRHDALARALQQRFEWRALQEAGRFLIGSERGGQALIDHGILVATWRNGDDRPLIGSPQQPTPLLEVPLSAEAAEEARLIWKWLEASGIDLHESTGSLALPRMAAHPLKRKRAA